MNLKNCFVGILMMSLVTSYAQQDSFHKKGEKHSVTVRFGEFTNGASINIAEHLNDTLSFTDPEINEQFYIPSFNLSLKCNGNTIKYMENKRGNGLTPEMKEAVLKLHPNCVLVFQGMKAVLHSKPLMSPSSEEMPLSVFKLTLK